MGACTFAAAPAGTLPADGVFVHPAMGGAGSQRMRRLQVNGSASYATGGESVSPASVGLRNVNKILVEPWEAAQSASQSGLSVQLAGTPQAPLLRMFDAVGAEIAAASNVSARPFIIWFIGD